MLSGKRESAVDSGISKISSQAEAVLRRSEGVERICVVEQEDAAGNPRLAVFVTPDKDWLSARTSDRSHEKQMETVWNAVYSGPSAVDPNFDTSGWVSSYDGEPIAADEMEEWVDNTARRLRSYAPRDVLEIGCGTGLLLFRIAPECRSYVGTDISAQAIIRVRDQLAAESHVSVRVGRAADIQEFDEQSFDTVILNSVAQYFPSLQHLQRVLAGAVRAVKSGGRVFIGDVRNASLLEAFRLSVALHQADDGQTLDRLRHDVRRAMESESELLVAPEFFYSLRETLPRVSNVGVFLKDGTSDNEMTKFRYDVVLSVGEHSDRPENSSEELDWSRDGLSVSALDKLLEGGSPKRLIVRNVPSRRISMERRALNVLSGGHGLVTVGELREVLSKSESDGGDSEMIPDDFRSLNTSSSYSVAASWSPAGDDRFDLVITNRAVDPVYEDGVEQSLSIDHALLANDPRRAAESRALARRLRDRLSESVEIPCAVFVMDALPSPAEQPFALDSLLASHRADPDEAAASDPALRLTEIFRDLFHDEKLVLDDGLTASDVHGWDSLNHVKLIVAVEQEFKVKFAMHEITALENVGDLKQLIGSKTM